MGVAKVAIRAIPGAYQGVSRPITAVLVTTFIAARDEEEAGRGGKMPVRVEALICQSFSNQ